MTTTALRPPERVGLQFAWVSGGRVVAALSQALLMVLLIRSVPAGDFALVGAAYGVLIFLQTVAGMGLQALIIRERARPGTRVLVATALGLSDRVAVVMAAALTVIAVIAGLFWAPSVFWLFPLAVWVAGEMNADTWMGVTLADGEGHLVTANLVGRRLLNLGLFVGLSLAPWGSPVFAFAISSAVSSIASVGFAHLVVRGRLHRRHRLPVGAVLHRSSGYWLNSMATMARNLDASLTAVVATPTQVSFYAAATRLSGPMRLLPQSLATVLLPVASRRGDAGLRSGLRLIFRVLAAIAGLYAVGAIALPWVVPRLLGTAYQGAVLTLQVTVVGLIFASAAGLLSSQLQGVGRTAYVARTAVLTTVLCLAGVALGAWRWGAPGAAAGSGLSYLVQSAVLFAEARRIARSARLDG